MDNPTNTFQNSLPDVSPIEVEPRAKRRQFTAVYKRRIVAEAEACTAPGQIGALLRREGLYSSTLSRWRGQQQALASAPGRGRKPASSQAETLQRLRQENARLKRKLTKAETVIEVQKKLCVLFGADETAQGE